MRIIVVAVALGAGRARRAEEGVGAVFLVWVANRKRIAAETVGRAEEQALGERWQQAFAGKGRFVPGARRG